MFKKRNLAILGALVGVSLATVLAMSATASSSTKAVNTPMGQIIPASQALKLVKASRLNRKVPVGFCARNGVIRWLFVGGDAQDPHMTKAMFIRDYGNTAAIPAMERGFACISHNAAAIAAVSRQLVWNIHKGHVSSCKVLSGTYLPALGYHYLRHPSIKAAVWSGKGTLGCVQSTVKGVPFGRTWEAMCGPAVCTYQRVADATFAAVNRRPGGPDGSGCGNMIPKMIRTRIVLVRKRFPVANFATKGWSFAGLPWQMPAGAAHLLVKFRPLNPISHKFGAVTSTVVATHNGAISLGNAWPGSQYWVAELHPKPGTVVIDPTTHVSYNMDAWTVDPRVLTFTVGAHPTTVHFGNTAAPCMCVECMGHGNFAAGYTYTREFMITSWQGPMDAHAKSLIKISSTTPATVQFVSFTTTQPNQFGDVLVQVTFKALQAGAGNLHVAFGSVHDDAPLTVK